MKRRLVVHKVGKTCLLIRLRNEADVAQSDRATHRPPRQFDTFVVVEVDIEMDTCVLHFDVLNLEVVTNTRRPRTSFAQTSKIVGPHLGRSLVVLVLIQRLDCPLMTLGQSHNMLLSPFRQSCELFLGWCHSLYPQTCRAKASDTRASYSASCGLPGIFSRSATMGPNFSCPAMPSTVANSVPTSRHR